MKKISAVTLSTLLASSMFASGAMADNYLGVGVGSADLEGYDDSSFKIFGGTRNANLGFEVAYHDFGSIVSLRVEYQASTLDVEGEDIDLENWSVGATFKF
ncbi:MAG: hypothetical protein P8Y24_08220 [Gammaproteobacteria bacterium]